MSWVCILIAFSVSPPSLFSLVLGPKSHCLSRPPREALLASPSCYLPFSAARTNPQREAQQKLARTPVMCIAAQDPSWGSSRDREAGPSHTVPPGRQAGIQSYLFAFGGPRSQRTNIRILQNFSHSSFSYPQGLGVGPGHTCAHPHTCLYSSTHTRTVIMSQGSLGENASSQNLRHFV